MSWRGDCRSVIMISKEKFNELNSEKKKIYYLDYGLLGSCSVKELDFSKRRICGVCANYFPIPNEELEVHDYCNIQNDSDCDEDFVCYLKDCYETQEDAEFAKEFKNITRTETLNLPTWEELNIIDEIKIYGGNGRQYLLQADEYDISIYADDGYDFMLYKQFDRTKENYLEACKMVKKLFLGDKMYD